MKQNDIFEREFGGNVYRFQVTKLIPHKVRIELLNDTHRIDKEICYILAPPYPNYVFASMESGEFVTTKRGDNAIGILAHEIYKRIKDWHFSVQWVGSNTSLKNDEAKNLVDKMYLALGPDRSGHWLHDRYLPTVVRWVCYGEIDPDNETDIERMRNLLSYYHDHLAIRTKEKVAMVGYKVDFDDNGFKRCNVDGTVIRLEKMKETEEALRSWSNA